jgi:type I restriction enzyme, S subunit
MNNWKVEKFGNLYEIPSRNGITRPRNVRGKGYKMINMGELFAYPRINDPCMELVELNDKEKEAFNILEGDLLFARQSLVLEGAGKCSIVIKVASLTTFESHLIRVRLKKKVCNALYSASLFSTV